MSERFYERLEEAKLTRQLMEAKAEIERLQEQVKHLEVMLYQLKKKAGGDDE